MICGIGTDIVECDRVEGVIKKHHDSLAQHILSAKEMDLWIARNRQVEFLAGRWAAKEAFAKALGCGFDRFCISNEIEVLPDENGAPHVTLYGNTKKTADGKGIQTIHISISHEKHYAVAAVLLDTSCA